MTYLTASGIGVGTDTYRYYVELASTQVDPDGVALEFRLVDVVVAEPTRDALATVIADCEWLSGYEIVSYWQPDYDESPF